MKYECIALAGPTASGKTGKAVALARFFNGEIISADSRQVYKEMNLGTGKDLEEYGDIPYHLIDIAEAGTAYNLHQYLRDFSKAYSDVFERGKFPIICGGSGMYLENALNGIKLPEVRVNDELRMSLAELSLEQLTSILKRMKTLHNVTDVDTKQRAIRAIEIQQYYIDHPLEAIKADSNKTEPLNALIIALDIPREERRSRISQRLDARLKAGMLEEVEGLIASGLEPEKVIYYGLEYKYLTEYIIGKLTYNEMHSQLEIAIHQFAKRQMTWLRGMERRGFKLHWLPYNLDNEEFCTEVNKLIDSH